MKRIVCLMLLVLPMCVVPLVARESELDAARQRVMTHREEQKNIRGDVAIIVGSDTNRDESGQLAAKLLSAAGYNVRCVMTVPNLRMGEVLNQVAQDPQLIAVLCIGGTGISPHDVTIEAIENLHGRLLPGYGEMLRRLTDERWKSQESRLGPLSLSTRAIAVALDNKIVFALPGSPDGTELAVSEVIIPSLPFLIGQFRKPVSSG